jgi:hypothetical protein
MVTKDQVLARTRRPPVAVSVPEWGGDVFVRVLSAGEMLAMEPLLTAAKDDAPRQLDVQIAAYLCNEDNSLWFTSPDEAAAMRAQEAAVVSRIVKAGARANGLSSEALAGNS